MGHFSTLSASQQVATQPDLLQSGIFSLQVAPCLSLEGTAPSALI